MMTMSSPRFGAVSVERQTTDLKNIHPSTTMDTDTRFDTTEVRDDSYELVGTVKQAKESQTDVKFFQGKGGLTAIVTTDDLRYILLPGSHLDLLDTVVDLPGDPIGLTPGKENVKVEYGSDFKPQTVTKQAMILGAGLASRFEPVSGDTTGFSKPGVPLVGDASVIVNIGRHLKQHGFNRVIVNTFYMPQQIKDQLTQQVPGVEFVFIDETSPSGTAGGLVKALQQGEVDRKQPLLIVQGDAVTDANLSELVNSHAEHNAKVTIGVQKVEDKDVSKVGILATDRSGSDGESGAVTSFLEKPSLAEAGDARLGSTGFYVISPKAFGEFQKLGSGYVAQNKEFDYAKTFFPTLLENAKSLRAKLSPFPQQTPVWAETLRGYWSDVGNPAQYIQTVRDIFAGRVGLPLPANVQEFFDNGVIYWPGAKAKAEAGNVEVTGNVIVAQKP